MRCTMYISHLNSVKNHLYYYDTVLVNMEFSFAPTRTYGAQACEKFSQMRAKALTLNFN